MQQMYDDELHHLLDRLLVLPVRQFNDRQRPSDPDSTRSASCETPDPTARAAFTAASRRATAATTSSPTTASSDVAAAVVKAIVAKALWYNERRLYRRLRCRKCTEFWRDKIVANELYPRSLWRTVDVLLGRGRIPSSLAIDVEIFCQFFHEKIAKVRPNTSGAPPPIRIQLRATRNA